MLVLNPAAPCSATAMVNSPTHCRVDPPSHRPSSPAVPSIKRLRPMRPVLLAMRPGNLKPQKRFADVGHFNINEPALWHAQLPTSVPDPATGRTRPPSGRDTEWLTPADFEPADRSLSGSARHHGTVRHDVTATRELGELRAQIARLRAENARLLRLLQLTPEQARPARPAQTAVFEQAPGAVDASSPAAAKIAFFRALFRARDDAYAHRWETAATDAAAGCPPCRAGGSRVFPWRSAGICR